MLTQTKRPFSFDEIIGQKGIIKEMKQRSRTMDFPEVMIFSGPSGIGKTTLAYIIASIINDPDPIINDDKSKSPNLNSPSTKSIREEKFNRNTSFYDASSMSKDDIVKLKSKLSSNPMIDKNKIIIIDEAQELSKAGKGATLNLLEKKRKNTYFILCTMAIESFDKAITSRGSVYNFKSPSSTDIAEYLFSLTDDYELPDTPEVEEFLTKGIFLLSENCEDSVRIAVQNFERCIYGEFFTEADIEREFTIISKDKLANILEMIVNKEAKCLKEIKTFGAKEFFYKAFKTLNSAFVYHNTDYIDQSWKKYLAEKLRDKNIEKLLEYFIKIDSQVYFKEDLFYFYLSKYLSEKEEKKIKLEDAVQKPVRKPVRTRVPVRR